MSPRSTVVSRALAVELAAAATVDPRTAARALTEGSAAVRGTAAVRLARAMHAMGLRDLAPSIPITTQTRTARPQQAAPRRSTGDADAGSSPSA